MQKIEDELAAEAVYFHRSLFAREVDAIVVTRYIDAHQRLFQDISSAEAAMIKKIIEHGLDVEAIELVLRLKRKHKVLTKKLQILFLLLEVRAQYYHHFIGEQSGFFHGFYRLIQGLLRTGVKWVRGTYLIRRHALV